MSRADELYEKYSTTKRFSTQNADERNKQYKRRSDELYDKYSTTRRFESSIQYAEDKEEKEEDETLVKPDTSKEEVESTTPEVSIEKEEEKPSETKQQSQIQTQQPAKVNSPATEKKFGEFAAQTTKKNTPLESSMLSKQNKGIDAAVQLRTTTLEQRKKQQKTMQNVQSSLAGLPTVILQKKADAYSEKVNEIAKSNHPDAVKNNLAYEEQLEYELAVLRMAHNRQKQQSIGLDPNKKIYTEQELKAAQFNSRYSFATNEAQKAANDTETLIAEKAKQLRAVQELNAPYHVMDDPELYGDLVHMYLNRKNPKVVETYSGNIKSAGYEPQKVLERYITQKNEEAVKNPKVVSLLNEIYAYNTRVASDYDDEYDDSYIEKVMKEQSGYKAPHIVAMEARSKLADMGYDVDELYAFYSSKLNQEATETLMEPVRNFAREHPVLGGITSIALTPLTSFGGIGAVARSVASGTPVDPNDPSMIFANTKSTIDSTAVSNANAFDGLVYKTATTLGSMLVNQGISSAVGGGPLGYALLSAAQALTSSVQEDSQKGYSVEQIAANALVSGAITFAASSLGFEKVFSSKTVYEQGLKKAFITAGLSEAGEEIAEDSVNIAAKNITNYVFNHETEIKADAQKYMSTGYSEDEAYTRVWSDIALQLAETGAISFITGSASNVVKNSPQYLDGVARLVGKQINIDLDSTAGRDAFDKLDINIGNATTDTKNEQKTPLNSSVVANDETVDTPKQNAVTEQNTGYANEFDNLYNEDVSEEIEQPAEEVDTTVGEDGTVYFEFDDDTDFDAVNEEVKTEYDTEAKADLTEKIEPYSSGNSTIDAMINPKGTRGRAFTIDEQAEQRLIDTAKRFFNRNVRFEDDIEGGDGYLDRDTGDIVLSRNSDKQHVTVFGHEFTHTLEGTADYDELFTFLRHNSPYIKNKVADFGSWKAVVDNKIAEYERIGVKLTTETAEYEIIADAVADEFFSDYKTMENLATQNRSLFTKLKQWFYTNVLKLNDNTSIYGKRSAARKTYALMIKAEKAANGIVRDSESTKKQYSVVTMDDGKQYVKADRQVIIGNNPKEWRKQITSYINDSVRNGRDVIVYAKDGDALTITRDTAGKAAFRNTVTMKNGKKRAMTDEEYATKLRAESHIDELAKVSTRGNKVVPDTKNHPFAKDGFNYRTAYFMDNDGQYYQITLSVGKNGAVNTIYNVGKLKKEAEYSLSGSKAVTDNSATMRSASNDNISDSAENVNENISYSAKKPEIISGLQADYGYSEASANNIYRAAKTLKQNTGSTADVERLTSAIVTSLENRKNGDIDSGNIERIAMMLAENAQAVNESYVSEYKPIMDYLKGTKISISETDISDLGDAFSYVKQRLFPQVTLVKEGGTPVDTVFQELSARFPNTFDAENVTHPADQVKAIAGFIEEYRDNYYFKPYFEGDEAYAQLRDTVSELVNDKLIDNSTYLKRLTEMRNTYGELKNGIPQSTDRETRVRRGAASIFGTEAVQKSPERVERFVRDFVNGKHDYRILRISEKAKAYVDNIKVSDNVAETIMSEYSRLRRKLTSNERLRPIDIIQAHALNPLLGDIISDDDYVEFTMLVTEAGTESAQITSSFNLISQFSGVQRLKAIDNKIEQINAVRSKGYPSDAGANAVADENGQFKITDEKLSEGKTPKGNGTKGFIELAVSKKQSKHPPIEIPERLRNNLKKAKTQAEIEKAVDDIHKYVEKQMKPTWFDRFNAWRYFAMLSNPKTAVRNTVGNVAMGATARMKDVIAAAVSATPIAKKYKDSSVQTSAVKTTKEARNAATQIIVGSDLLFGLYSGQDKYTGRESGISQGETKLYKLEQKIAERNPLLDTILHNRSIQPSAMAKTGRAIVDKPFGALSDFQQRMLDDTLYKVLRSKSVLAQSITQAVKNGNIENLNDFLAVALNGNTEHLDNATKTRYAQLFDKIVHQAAKEGDEATFRDDNEFANALNKFAKGNSKGKRALSIAVDALIPFKKTPANIVKRGYEYSPVALGVSLISDRVKLAKGEIDRNTYINNIAKGLTGTLLFGVGALLSSLGILNIGDDDEEDKAERKLLGGQNYSVNVGDGTYTIEFFSPAALPMFMGGKVYETVVSVLNGDEIKATEFILDVMQGVAEPMFAQTMLDGIDGAFEAISRDSAYDDTAGASFMALVNYCAENWAQQFVPSFLGGIARTADDTVRSYYNEPGKDEGLLDNLMVGIKKKLPGKTDETPAKLDMWGQPMSTGTLTERLIENFISPGYYEKNTEDEATLALHEFADDNDIPYTEILPKEVPKYYDFRSKKYNLTAEEYEYYAGVIGKARKEAVEKALVDGDDIEVSYRFYDIKPANDSGITFKDVTFTGNLADATNTYGWAPSGESEGYFEYEYSDEDNKKKAVKKTAATDEEFRQFLFDAYMLEVTEKAAFEARKEIAENKKIKRSDNIA